MFYEYATGMSNLVKARVVCLGFAYFYSLFFLTKYFDWSLSASYSLLLISIFPTVGFLMHTVLKRIPVIFPWIPFIGLACIWVLSSANIHSSVIAVCLCAFVVFACLQSKIVSLFEENSSSVKALYVAEIFGGLIGSISWYLFSAKIGFSGFAGILAATLSFSIFFEKSGKAVYFLWIVATMALVLFIRAPQPIFDKRERLSLIERGSSLGSFWEPNGHAEFIKNDDIIFALFEGGDLRSNIPKFDGNYQNLKNRYLNSNSDFTWGLDVILPHFAQQDIPYKKVALISAMGGQEILAAKAFGAQEIFAIDINPTAQEYIANNLKSWSGNVYNGVTQIHKDGRFFIESSNQLFQVIQIYSAHNATYSATLGAELTPSSLITTEAIETYIDHLSPNGILQITQSEFQKVRSTFEASPKIGDITKSDKFLILKRSEEGFNLTSFYYKKDGWSEDLINQIKRWLSSDSRLKWDIVWDPDAGTKISKTDFKPALRLQSKPSVDNWPFSKVVRDLIAHTSFKCLIIGMVISLLLALVKLTRANSSIRPQLALSFTFGSSFAFFQPLLILISQRLVGGPAQGLATGNAVLMLAMMAGVFIRGSKSYKIGAILLFLANAPVFLFLTPDPDFMKVQLLIFFGIAIIQSGIFISNIPRDHILPYFLVNSFGILFGMALFHICFLSFGLRQCFSLATALTGVGLFLSWRGATVFIFQHTRN